MAATKTARLPWIDRALGMIAEGLHAQHRSVTGEDVRFWLRSKRLRPPAHPNAYGALILRAVQSGLLARTEVFAASEAPTSRGRARRVYLVPRPRRAGRAAA